MSYRQWCCSGGRIQFRMVIYLQKQIWFRAPNWREKQWFADATLRTLFRMTVTSHKSQTLWHTSDKTVSNAEQHLCAASPYLPLIGLRLPFSLGRSLYLYALTPSPRNRHLAWVLRISDVLFCRINNWWAIFKGTGAKIFFPCLHSKRLNIEWMFLM